MINKPIETDAEYRAALKEVETLLTLIELIEAYEAKHFPLLEEEVKQQRRDEPVQNSEDYKHMKEDLLEEEVEQQRRDEKNELYGPRKAYHLENNND